LEVDTFAEAVGANEDSPVVFAEFFNAAFAFLRWQRASHRRHFDVLQCVT